MNADESSSEKSPKIIEKFHEEYQTIETSSRGFRKGEMQQKETNLRKGMKLPFEDKASKLIL